MSTEPPHPPSATGPPPAPAELAEAVGAASTGLPSLAEVQALVSAAGRSARAAGVAAVASGRWLAATGLEVAGHLPVRNLAKLREQHRGLTGDPLAAELIVSAARAAGAVGAAGGTVAAVAELSPASWMALPVELAAETLIVVAIEMKLVAELHEAAGRPLRGSARERAVLVATAWSERRGIAPSELAGDPLALAATELLGETGRSRLADMVRRRMIRRAARNLTSFSPFLTGAAAGGLLNRRITNKLGRDVAGSLGLRPGL